MWKNKCEIVDVWELKSSLKRNLEYKFDRFFVGSHILDRFLLVIIMVTMHC